MRQNRTAHLSILKIANASNCNFYARGKKFSSFQILSLHQKTKLSLAGGLLFVHKDTPKITIKRVYIFESLTTHNAKIGLVIASFEQDDERA